MCSTAGQRGISDTAGPTGTEPAARTVEGSGTGPVLMVTGHRTLQHPNLVRERLGEVFARLQPRLAVSGGAQGADTLFAEVAIAAGVPLELVLPNRWYRHWYPDAVSSDVLAAAVSVRYAVERPDVDTWREQWSAQRWWQDNFARNTVLVDAAEEAVVVSPIRPLELAADPNGGTANCVRGWANRRGTRVVWVPDDPGISVRWSPTARPAQVDQPVAATLFDADT